MLRVMPLPRVCPPSRAKHWAQPKLWRQARTTTADHQTTTIVGVLKVLLAPLVLMGLAGCGSLQATWSDDAATPSTESVRPVEQTTKPTGTPGPPKSVNIVASGDILIHDSLWMQAEADGGGRMDFGPELAGVKARIKAADFAICHLETTLAPAGGPYTSYPVFATPPQLAQAIKKTGYDACSTVSNHTLDQGLAGVKQTLDELDAVGIGHSGTARSRGEAQTPSIYTVNGIRIAHLAYTYGYNGYTVPSDQPWCCNTISAPRMVADAKAAKAAGANIVIVSTHAGDENVAAPNAQQRRVAKALAASGAVNLILGNHVHVVQPVQKIGNMWIIYGHGNQLSGQYDHWPRNKEGVISNWTFTEQSDDSYAVTKAAGYPTLNVSNPIRMVDLVRKLPRNQDNARMAEAYQRTKATLLSMGAGRDGFVVPDPGSR